MKAHMNIMIIFPWLTIFNIYAPNDDEPTVKKDEFYDWTCKIAVDDISNTRDIIMMDDFNVRMWSKGDNEVIERYGEKRVNDNGNDLIDCWSQYTLKISNRFFKHKNFHRFP